MGWKELFSVSVTSFLLLDNITLFSLERKMQKIPHNSFMYLTERFKLCLVISNVDKTQHSIPNKQIKIILAC